MPEGDSVFQLARRLQPLTGREVLATSLRVPSVALVDFTGSRVERVWPYGKHLFMQFDERILHTHLKMEGIWQILRPGEKWRRPAHMARVVLDLKGEPVAERIQVVGFSLGFVRVFPVSEFAARMGYLGPDVLSPDWPTQGEAIAYERLAADPQRPIGTALLDQKNLAGVGNEYRAEICFLAGVHPATPVGAVDLAHILRITRRLMWANRLSPVRVSTGSKRPGETSYVFGRSRRACRRCGTPIQKGTLGSLDSGGRADELERIIWWCPQCQPLRHLTDRKIR